MRSVTFCLLLWILSYCGKFPRVCSKEVIVRNDVMTNWFHRAFEVEGNGDNWRTDTIVQTAISTCNPGEEVDFWLTTIFIDLNTTRADKMFVDTEAGFTLCDNPNYNPDKNNTKHVPCKSNYFEMYFHTGEYVFPGLKANLTDFENFTFLFNLTDGTLPNANLNRKNYTVSFNAENYTQTGLTVAVRSRGACGKLFRMKIYYFICEETFVDGTKIKLNRTISPPPGFVKNITGNCDKDGKPPNNDTSVRGYCYPNGTWRIPPVDGIDDLACFCLEGHGRVKNTNGTICVPPIIPTPTTRTTLISTAANSHTLSSPTQKPKQTKKDSNVVTYIIIGIICLLVLILIVLLILYIFKRRRNGEEKSNKGYINYGVELPSVGRRLYVDPSNYDDPEAALTEFANELDPGSIYLNRLIGGGEFGDVYQGELRTKDKKKIPIAAKTLKHDADAKSERDFMLEASVMGQFDNPNVVKMEGVVTKSTPRMIVLEYMSNGSLENFLKNNDNMLTNLQLIGMARGVAAGMKYLAEIHFVHRDLAARNVLLNDSLLCKIADFGLSRELQTTDSCRGEYSTSGGKIPIRWTAPEAIKYRKYSTASDVWSYGILLWEIMSFAERPYWEWDNMKVVEEIESGYRLPPPLHCPKGVHELMLGCWKAKREERPSFAQITFVLDQWIRSPETLDNEDVNLSKSEIDEWLTSIKMNNYVSKFVEAGYRRKSELVDLTDDDLKKIGVSLIGHRNKVMKSIDAFKSEKDRDSLQV